MATVGFESVIFGVKTGVGGTLKELVVDKSKGGAIEAYHSSLQVKEFRRQKLRLTWQT